MSPSNEPAGQPGRIGGHGVFALKSAERILELIKGETFLRCFNSDPYCAGLVEMNGRLSVVGKCWKNYATKLERWYDLIFEVADFFESQTILAFCYTCVELTSRTSEFLVLQQHRGIWAKSTAGLCFPILRHMILLGVESFAVVNGLRSFFLLTHELLRISTTAKQVAPDGVDDCGSASAGELQQGVNTRL